MDLQSSEDLTILEKLGFTIPFLLLAFLLLLLMYPRIVLKGSKMDQTLNLSFTDEQFQSLQALIDDAPSISTSSEILTHCMESYMVMREYIEDLHEQKELLEKRNPDLELIVEDSCLATQILLEQGHLHYFFLDIWKRG